jgi:hypothetical protein
MLALHEAGYGVSIPFGENARYDLVIDDGGRLARVQCKTGRLRNGAIVFRTSSSYAHHRAPRQNRLHYQGQIDFFGVYCRATRGSYLVPIEERQHVKHCCVSLQHSTVSADESGSLRTTNSAA